MTSANLSRAETAIRSAAVSILTARVELDVTTAPDVNETGFATVSTLEIETDAAAAGSATADIETWIDFIGESVEAVEVDGDAGQLRQLLANLIDNALRHTPRGGRVSVETGVRGSRAELRVSDDGPGIAPADRDKLFMPYYSTKLRGSGLGLAIVQRLVAEHRGRIRVEENQPRGARFVVELPLEQKPESEPVSARSVSEAQEL